MSTPKDPEHTDDEQRPSESPSLSKQTGDTSGEEPAQPLTGAAPAQTPGAQPTEHDPGGGGPPARGAGGPGKGRGAAPPPPPGAPPPAPGAARPPGRAR
ncbi:hypothetical protein [Nocardia abscessus]|uniref:hypothetical protein n=1 Tax=Nocardia abscessus TaxID=120957 RepID=UPI002457B250|nr:hypothetical protein [Nocardia abscessus]